MDGLFAMKPMDMAVSRSTPAAASRQQLLDINSWRFAEMFNRRHFEVQHRLASHPLFQLPRLLELAREVAAQRPQDIYYDAGVKDIGSRWGTSVPKFSVDETIRHLESADAWIDLKSAERSRPYAQVLNACFADILEVSGRELERHMRRKQMAIFLTSPRRISTYHIDSECNFLLQLSGEKDISIFSKYDREVLPEQEIECSWAADTNAAIYKPGLQDHADVVHLRPWYGVHIPVNAPHWVKNGNDISVSVAILYHSQYHDYRNLYAANYCLRKIGINPKPPFQSRLRDSLKRPLGAAGFRMLEWRRGVALRELAGNAAGVHDVTPDSSARPRH